MMGLSIRSVFTNQPTLDYASLTKIFSIPVHSPSIRFKAIDPGETCPGEVDGDVTTPVVEPAFMSGVNVETDERHNHSIAPSGAMPVLRHVSHHAAPVSSDTRVLDVRQLRDMAGDAAQHLSSSITQLAKRLPQLQRRQSGGTVVAIPAVYQGLNSGPAPGTVVGIVLGSIAGFLLLLLLFWALTNGTGGVFRTTTYREEDVVVRRRSRSPRSRRSHRTEMAERSPRRERVIRQERIVRDVPPPREPSRIRETIIVDSAPPPFERRVAGDDIVEVSLASPT
nr:hypothetical protein CFP56_19330 [Quercus suber]